MQSSRDLGLHISSKLSGDWSAANVTSLLSEPVLEHLLARWETLDPLVRARLLLSPLFLRKKDLADLHSELERLAEVGAGDRDEWVRVLGRAVGSYDGKLHLEAVLKDSKLVSKTLVELKQLLDSADPGVFRPLEELYLNADVREAMVGCTPQQSPHQHFRPRKPSEAPSATAAGSVQGQQRSMQAGAAQHMAGGPHRMQRPSRPSLSNPQPDLFLPRKPVQRLPSGLSAGSLFGSGSSSRAHGSGAVGGLSSLSSSKPRPQGARRPAVLDPLEVKRMNEEAQRERERKAAEERAAREVEARQRAEARAAERAAKGELKRKRGAGAAKGSGGEDPSQKKVGQQAEQGVAQQAKQGAAGPQDPLGDFAGDAGQQ